MGEKENSRNIVAFVTRRTMPSDERFFEEAQRNSHGQELLYHNSNGRYYKTEYSNSGLIAYQYKESELGTVMELWQEYDERNNLIYSNTFTR